MGYRFTTPFVVSFGEAEFFLDRDFNQFRDQPSRSVVVLDGKAVTDDELASVCSTMMVDLDDTASTKPRVVILDNAHKFKPEKAMKAYAESKGPRDLGCVLAAIVRSEKPLSFWLKLGDKATLHEHKKLKTWDNNNEVIKWLQDEAKSMKLGVDSRIAAIMYQIAGDDLYRLSSELRKLLLLLGPGVSVTVDHLKLVMSPGTTAEPWTVSEAAFEKNSKKALNALSSLYKHATEDPSLPVLYAMMRQAERLFVARSLLDRGAAPDDVAARLGMHPYRFKMSLLPLAGKHTLRGLSLAMQNLCKLDVDLKRTSHSRRTLLELAVLDLAS
jgi:DNA polymerase III delta subunit